MFDKLSFKSMEQQLEEQGFRQYPPEQGRTLEDWIESLKIERKGLWLPKGDGTRKEIKDMYLVLAPGEEFNPDPRYILYYRTQRIK